MATPDVWDVVRVPFASARRPAVVIVRLDHHHAPALLWVLMITSAAHQRRAGDVEISDIKQAGLPALSLVRSAKIATIEAHQVEAIGALPEPDRAAVLVELTGLLSSALLRR